MHEYEHVDRTCDYVDPKVRVSTNTSLDTSICGADLLTVLELEINNLNHRILTFLTLTFQKDPVLVHCQSMEQQVHTLITWARLVPHFLELPTDDQVTLLKAGACRQEFVCFSHH